MGFKININTILRYDITDPLEVDREYAFKKPELCILTDSIQIWLTSKDWTALADIQITASFGKTTKPQEHSSLNTFIQETNSEY